MYDKGDKIEANRISGDFMIIKATLPSKYYYEYYREDRHVFNSSVSKDGIYIWGVPAR